MVGTRGQSPPGGAGAGGPVTGMYTGDGTPTQAIVGVGFQPRFVIVFSRKAAEAGPNPDWAIKSNQDGIRASIISPVDHRWYWLDDRIISLDADGFTVGDGAAGNFPNQAAIDYTYIAYR